MAKRERGFQRRLGTLVRGLRKELRWPMSKLGQFANCNEKTVSNVESCRWVNEQTIVAVTDAINRGLKDSHEKGQLQLPFAVLRADDLFEFDGAAARGKAKTAPPQFPDDRRKFLKAFLTDRVNREKAS